MNIRNHYSIQFLYYILLWIDILSKITILLELFWGVPHFWAKADAKVLLFFELTKYFGKKNHKKCIFLVKVLILSNIWFCDFWGTFAVFVAEERTNGDLRGKWRIRTCINIMNAGARAIDGRKMNQESADLSNFVCIYEKKAVLLHS